MTLDKKSKTMLADAFKVLAKKTQDRIRYIDTLDKDDTVAFPFGRLVSSAYDLIEISHTHDEAESIRSIVADVGMGWISACLNRTPKSEYDDLPRALDTVTDAFSKLGIELP